MLFSLNKAFTSLLNRPLPDVFAIELFFQSNISYANPFSLSRSFPVHQAAPRPHLEFPNVMIFTVLRLSL